MSTTSDPQIENVLKEGRVFPPPAEFSAQARVKSLAEFEALYQESVTDPEGFWAKHASDLHWFEPWSQVLKWDAPHAEWFVGGKTNLSYNCLDRHVHGPNRNKAAIIFEGEPGDVQVLTYYALWREVQRFANVLKGLGLKSGDRVAIYMPMIPEAAIAMLACARIGVIHSVIFGGFSSEAIAERVNDAGAKVIITCDGGWRRGSVVPLKANVDNALHHHHCPTIEKVIVHRRTGNTIQMHPGRDVEWSDLMAAAAPDCPAEPLDSEHPLFILYTSGSTGKPKGVMHTTAGYMLYTYLTTGYVFDLQPTDVHWCTADVGWVTGHSYVVYGPLANGATTLLYEGAPNYPDWDRNWSIIERHGVTVFYTAPTAIRTFFRHGNAFPEKHDLSSLRLLGTVGEPINPEAWIWYHKVIGGGRCPIVDTWWQTETGGIMITSLPGAVPQKPASAGRPFFGIQPAIVNKDGNPVGQDEGGFLIITHPWPGMLRTLWGDDERFKQAYWSQHPGAYFTGDGARRDSDGDYWLLGRIDDVVNISGHRLGTAEVESTLVGHHSVAESAVIGRPDEITGEALVAFVTLKGNQHRSPSLKEELIEFVAEKIGKFARPAELRFTDALPKTRSGKIMRRLLRKVAVHDPSLGDTTTLEDISVLSKLQEDED